MRLARSRQPPEAELLAGTEVSATPTLRAGGPEGGLALLATCTESREALLFWDSRRGDLAVAVEGAPSARRRAVRWRDWRYVTLSGAQVGALIAGGAITVSLDGRRRAVSLGDDETRRTILGRCAG